MEKVIEYKIEIVGASPMIHNKLSKDLLEEIKSVPKDRLENWEETNYEKKLYTRKIDGETYVIQPEENLKSFLSESAKKYKVSPPKSIGRTWTNYMKSALIVNNPLIINYESIKAFGKMVNGNPSSTKGSSSKVYRVRPIIENWSGYFTVMDVGGYLDKDTLHNIISAGGLFVGLSDWRPQYGRFKVKSIKATEVVV